MSPIKIEAHIEKRLLARPFRIAGNQWLSIENLVVQVSDGKYHGRGEAQGVFYLGETGLSMLEQVSAAADTIQRGISRVELLAVLPPGGARNAIDCAIWDWEAKKSGRSIWELTDIVPRPVTTVFTIGIEATAEQMAANAKAAAQYPVLKIKLDQHVPLQRLSAIRAARPDAKIVVDANQAWSFELLQDLLPRCAELNVSMIEQPLPRGEDAALADFRSPVTLAADESCLDTSELEDASARYDMINIKLDKTGGLTEALRLARQAKARDCQLMVDNMVGTSLSMAPAFVIAQCCELVDIDGPLLLQNDCENGLRYHHGTVDIFDPVLWG